MLLLEVKAGERFDEAQQRFITTPPAVLRLEHSLKAISKWESKWHKSFVSSKDINFEQTIDYIKCMEVTGNVKPEVFQALDRTHVQKINDYITESMTASVVHRRGPQKPSREIVTSELIYFWMIQYGIPFTPCENWHLNRLLMLVEICGVKTGSQKKMSAREQMAQQRAINATRRANLHTRG